MQNLRFVYTIKVLVGSTAIKSGCTLNLRISGKILGLEWGSIRIILSVLNPKTMLSLKTQGLILTFIYLIILSHIITTLHKTSYSQI